MSQKPTNQSAFPILVSVFFFWGFVAASNDILIPVFKKALNLEQWQSQMISFAFYVAYTVGSIIYTLISKTLKVDILSKIGYKNGIALGLVISAVGSFLFFPAAQASSFNIMLTGLFIVGLGFSLQQTAANPLAIVMGNPATGSQRLSFAGGINNVGTTIGPLLVSIAIFGRLNPGEEGVADLQSVQVPYIILGAAFLLVAVIIKFSSIPNKIESSHEETNESSEMVDANSANRSSALSYPQLILGMIAIFLYVGVEVSTAGNLSEFMIKKLDFKENQCAPFVSLFWASLMIGRLTSSVGAFFESNTVKQILNVVVPYLAFGFFLLVNVLAGHEIGSFYVYGAVILVLVVLNFISQGNPAKQLLLFAIAGVTALFVGMFSSGMVSVYAFISVGLFCSTLWPCIFTLAISGLGKHTTEGSNFLIMMIMGGGFVSLLQGSLADDNLLGIQGSYIVGVLCFAYLAFYAWRVSGILKKQGVSFDTVKGGGH
jgi:FHS family L-fucose permease-like MFS transporter